MTTITHTNSYRKTKTGEWVVYGTADHLNARLDGNGEILVTTKAGQVKTEHLTKVGKTFTVDGVAMAYGYIAQAPRIYTGSSRKSCISGGDCSSFGSGRHCGGHDCDGY